MSLEINSKHMLGEEEFLCLLPISRIYIEEPLRLTEKISIHPKKTLTPGLLRVVDWPQRALAEFERRPAAEDSLPWYQSAQTGIGLSDFFHSNLIAVALPLDWDLFLSPLSHNDHLMMIEQAAVIAERSLDFIRFKYCNLWNPNILPGRAGLLENSPYSAALFYSPSDVESYIVGGSLIRRVTVSGVGLDCTNVQPLPRIENGELGRLFRSGISLLSDAMEATTETSRFVQMMTLLEFLANPFEYTKMKGIRKVIAIHLSSNQTEYNSISNFLQRLSSFVDHNGVDIGIRHNIVHLGKKFEEVANIEERNNIFRKLQIISSRILKEMAENSHDSWIFIENRRVENHRILFKN